MTQSTAGNQELLIDRLELAVLSAARHIDAFFLSSAQPTLEYKLDDSMVMNVDLDAQAIMTESLTGLIPIVGEEDPESHSLIETAPDYFLLDPLDGTTSAKRFRATRGGQVGFGPLGGLVLGGRLVASSFYHLPTQTLLTAVGGQGVRRFQQESSSMLALPHFREREKLAPVFPTALRQCGTLFFPGTRGEIPIVGHLRSQNIVENVYRFGGFANDCTRLALGHEQLQVQFAVKAWDYSAALLCVEAGLSVICDPLGAKVPFDEWKISLENPLITAPTALIHDFLAAVNS